MSPENLRKLIGRVYGYWNIRMKRIVTAAVALLMSGCAGTTFYLNSDYQYEKENDALSLFPLTSDAVRIGNCHDEIRHFYKTDDRPEKEIIIDSAYNHIFEGMMDTITSFEMIGMNSLLNVHETQTSTNYNPVNKRAGSDSTLYTFYTPTKVYLGQTETDADVLFIINKLELSCKSGRTGLTNAVSMNGGAVSVQNGPTIRVVTITAKVTFIVIDCERNEIISCGSLKTEALMNGWNDLYTRIGKKLGARTPFRRD